MSRPPTSPDDLRFWLQNMVWHHQFSIQEIQEATGLSPAEIRQALQQFQINPQSRPARHPDDGLLVLPYPGGRHPRIGFLEGAIRPQRDTKISVFTPWDDSSYVVLDIPEALWSNLGLTYLAHTHIDTVWDKQNIQLPPQEWNRREDGAFDMERRLPNGVVFGTKVMPQKNSVLMDMWLTNGSPDPLSDLRVQNCVMLKGARGFEPQTNDNKLISNPYVACRAGDGRRWIISAWEPCHRPWANPPCPCLHSDPKFPDCPPGATQRLKGWLSFYQGVDIIGEFNRLHATNSRRKNAR